MITINLQARHNTILLPHETTCFIDINNGYYNAAPSPVPATINAYAGDCIYIRVNFKQLNNGAGIATTTNGLICSLYKNNTQLLSMVDYILEGPNTLLFYLDTLKTTSSGGRLKGGKYWFEINGEVNSIQNQVIAQGNIILHNPVNQLKLGSYYEPQ